MVKKLHDACKLARDEPKPRDIPKKCDYVERSMDSATSPRFVGEPVAEHTIMLEKLRLAKKE